MDGFGLLYSEDEVKSAILESRDILKSYRRLKVIKRLKFPYMKSPIITDMPRGGNARIDTDLDKYIEIVSTLDHIERCVARCELTQSIILQKKFIDSTEYSQAQLAALSGYSISRYNDYLRQAYLQFLSAYKANKNRIKIG